MGRKRKYNRRDKAIAPTEPRLKTETRHGILAILTIAISLFFVLSGFGRAGAVGTKIFQFFSWLFGVGYFILPVTGLLLGASFFRQSRPNLLTWRLAGSLIILFSSLTMISLIFGEAAGGLAGSFISAPLLKLFDFAASLVFLSALILISFFVLFDTHLTLDGTLFGFRLFRRRDEEESEVDESLDEAGVSNEQSKLPAEIAEAETNKKKDKKVESDGELGAFGIGAKLFGGQPKLYKDFTPPPLSLLEGDSGKPGVGDIKANANIIKRTLANFGINVEMDEISIGPSVTRYALKPAEGVKLSRIVGLQNDLALALAAHPIRIEAPIPGKSLVGIEIPNKVKSIVGLASLVGARDYIESPHPLYIALGRGISGQPCFGNVAKAPHMLIAGATGSGKSVTIHTIITSLLYRNPPNRLRFIMIDPKRVELTLYNKIPHLLTPVITDAKKAIAALRWATKEMERRYNILEAESVRDIQSYHKNTVEPAYGKLANKKELTPEEEASLPEQMPYIVIIIDELADIMSTYPRELEAAVVRLAQMSRAVGIHLILSTQRPSVDVITGLIKANIPSRIAMQVASQIDSRTILDAAGAEKLLGAGDMLYVSGEMSKPIRIQSAFISESEVKQVAKYLADNYADEVPMDIGITESTASGGNGGGIMADFEQESGDDDDLYEEARLAVIQAKKASASYLQRKLKVGYARAARLLDLLEERNVIGPGDGAKPREVYEKPPEENYQ